jgi:hypothetical protein
MILLVRVVINSIGTDIPFFFDKFSWTEFVIDSLTILLSLFKILMLAYVTLALCVRYTFFVLLLWFKMVVEFEVFVLHRLWWRMFYSCKILRGLSCCWKKHSISSCSFALGTALSRSEQYSNIFILFVTVNELTLFSVFLTKRLKFRLRRINIYYKLPSSSNNSQLTAQQERAVTTHILND